MIYCEPPLLGGRLAFVRAQMCGGLVIGDTEIRPLREEEIALLEQMNHSWPYGRPQQLHQDRFRMQQEGEAVYLFAWHRQIPIGHVLLRWHRTSKAPYDPASERT